MRWVHHIEPLTLSQESDIPYVIHRDGVLLCFDNMYRLGQSEKSDDFFITFKTSYQVVMRQSTNYYRFYDFPVLIPFEDIICVNETIIDGKLVKLASEKQSESANITMVKESYVIKLSDDELQGLAEDIESFKSFILVGDEIDTNVRLLSNFAETIHHTDWGRTCVTVADRLCDSPSRKYCWTKAVPTLEIITYGLRPEKDIEKLYNMFTNLEIEVATRWGG